MAGIGARFKARAKKVADWAGLNHQVGREVFPDRKTFRPAPVSGPHPDFSLNFPLKTENVAEIRYAERQPRLQAQSPEYLYYKTFSTDPKLDPRNMFNSRNMTPWEINFNRPRFVFDLVDPGTGDIIQTSKDKEETA